ncbi:MAG: hypothetical protein J6D21_07055 [Clostridia bacterium]|nr:hypothetical protein [Clostridia bacterium]
MCYHNHNTGAYLGTDARCFALVPYGQCSRQFFDRRLWATRKDDDYGRIEAL